VDPLQCETRLDEKRLNGNILDGYIIIPPPNRIVKVKILLYECHEGSQSMKVAISKLK